MYVRPILVVLLFGFRGRTENLLSQANRGSSFQVRQELEHELHTALVPGTEIMTDVGSHHFIKSERNSTVLVPQPSDSLHDPLVSHLLDF